MILLNKLLYTEQWRNFPFPEEDVIHLFEAGSALHGARLAESSDLDICGVFIEPPQFALGLDKFEHYVTSTSGNGERNSKDDVDICLYSLRRWAYLAAKGNPTALSFLFAPNDIQSSIWQELKEPLRQALVCKSAHKSFKGFVNNQMGRILGTKGMGKHGQRPELINNFGYDTKAAMHAFRLIEECIDLMYTGSITYPRPDAQFLLRIREGGYSLDKICGMVNDLMVMLDRAVKNSDLPEHCDRNKVSSCLSWAYGTHWSRENIGIPGRKESI